MSNVVTLLTDFGDRDGFTGIMKGVMLTINPALGIVDLAHGLEAGNINAAAFVLQRSYSYFPQGTIHIVVVDPGVGSTRRSVILAAKGYYFIGPDNGVFDRIESVQKCIHITNTDYCLQLSHTFHGRDIFAPVAAHISKGVSIDTFGPELKDYQQQNSPKPEGGLQGVRGEIIYIDRFGNLVTNIAESFLQNRRLKESIIKGYTIAGLCRAYAERKKGALLNIFGSHGNLEIACNQGSAAELMEVNVGESIYVRFY